MDKLITIIPSNEVTAEYKEEAKTWPKWDSKTRKKFPFNYTAEERVLILEGSAELTPTDGSPVVTIQKGEQVTFHNGFKCKWKITKRMKKHYTVIQDEGAQAAPAIACDVCDVDCVAESYFVAQEEEDICPKCYENDKERYAGAEHQKEGVRWVEPAKTKTKSTAEKPKKKRKTKA
mmetsp:Transcript_38714/g.45079  ORF Transcript_38714/g.45079 Transcript_38714/m.45079 type:complete len:176 (+) Transcript_38714:126-653(+)|eukprot:CAMPEP_0171313888 /NCGR_PEP_ID=MMETSP0816-20121228/46681_1 /TAXON_ID=420281 /ORGANISM="Proboscia inermis, Strain CCAP1064/1" /LENGTH=175 /DNA_ID=CAMNT_0011802005 /DNA_START=126 /DNA_END=653 /DNA_ORIENTATION=+